MLLSVYERKYYRKRIETTRTNNNNKPRFFFVSEVIFAPSMDINENSAQMRKTKWSDRNIIEIFEVQWEKEIQKKTSNKSFDYPAILTMYRLCALDFFLSHLTRFYL